MKKFFVGGASIILIGAVTTLIIYRSHALEEQRHYDREETEVFLTNLPRANVSLFKAGGSLEVASGVAELKPEGMWLPRGNYFLKVEQGGKTVFYPIPLVSYRGGPDKEGAFTITIRPLSPESPPRLLSNLPEFAFIPSGHLLFGDHLRPSEPHYVWLPA